MPDVVVLVLVLAVTAVAWWWWRRREGALRAGRPGERLTAGDRAALGVPATGVVLVEFTAPGCRSCEAAKDVLERVAAGRPAVAVATADVGEHLDLARAHGVLRAPTTLVVDGDGVVRHRISGVPSAAALAAAVDDGTRAA